MVKRGWFFLSDLGQRAWRRSLISIQFDEFEVFVLMHEIIASIYAQIAVEDLSSH